MRRARRADEPAVLGRNKERWTKALLAEAKRCKRSGEKVADAFFDGYRKSQVTAALGEMYNELCCYCEAKISVVSYSHIEHRKPKRKFLRDAFAWPNLHLACERCNKAKGEKWDDDAPILDACVDEVASHLTYMESGVGLRRWPANDSARGETTINHALLNRDAPGGGLLAERQKVYMETLKTIRALNKVPSSPETRAQVSELLSKHDGQYGSVIAWAMEELLKDEHRETNK